MRRSKMRWAWTAQQRRPKIKPWNSRPNETCWYHRLLKRKHQFQSRQGLILIRQGADEGPAVFLYHHPHWLKRW